MRLRLATVHGSGESRDGWRMDADFLQAPFPWFGGKSRVAADVWARFGDVPNYVEPFAGSLAVLLGRPHDPQIETVNDLDGFIANFWRALQHAPDEVARWADWPVNENDLTARHAWLVRNHLPTLAQRLEGDPDFYDAKIAGWWVWGLCSWIGSGWCSGVGPWQADENGVMAKAGGNGDGVKKARPHLGNAGRGINRQLPHLNTGGAGVNRVSLSGVNRKRPALGSDGRQLEDGQALYDYMRALAARLRRVRVCCGDWSRVCGPSPTVKLGVTGVFLDPPYSDLANRDPGLYATDSLDVAHECRKWALEQGDNPLLRIALCGYTGEHDGEMTDAGWTPVYWKAAGGYGSQADANGNGRANSHREVIWFSPHCLQPHIVAPTLFDFEDDE
jgi:Site-specific DNA methylase